MKRNLQIIQLIFLVLTGGRSVRIYYRKCVHYRKCVRTTGATPSGLMSASAVPRTMGP